MNNSDHNDAVSGPFGDGRGAGGRFTRGNPGGPGNPHASMVSTHRARLLAAITEGDIEKAVEIIREIMNDTKAKPADRLAAARELLDRVCGKPVPQDFLERIERIEALVAGRGAA